jgi:hypothetical protein
MEDLTRLVDDSLARHGVRPTVDHRRLQWSRWFRCESSFGLWLVPNQPGLYALGEEVFAPGESAATGGKRMLAIFQISDTRDLGIALGRMFTSSHPLHDRVAEGRCFARYAIVTDVAERASCLAAFQKWLNSSAETASGFSADSDPNTADWPPTPSERPAQAPAHDIPIKRPISLPSGF